MKRKVDKTDQRAFIVHLTGQGRKVAVRCNRISAAIYAELFDEFDEGRVSELVAHLAALDTKLRSINAADLETPNGTVT